MNVNHYRIWRRYVGMLIGLLYAALSACSVSTPTPTLPVATPTAISNASVIINMVEPPFKPMQTWYFDPAVITVHVGTKITWVNGGDVLHTVTTYDNDVKTINSGDIPVKGSFSWTPVQPGIFKYQCTYHMWMKGVVIVVP